MVNAGQGRITNALQRLQRPGAAHSVGRGFGNVGNYMESIYYSISWVCHRRCVHCYEEKFRPYSRREMPKIVGESLAAWPKIVGNLPGNMRYRDSDGQMRTGRIVLSGGEVLHAAVREPVLYSVIAALRGKYGADGVKIVVQTTGDLLSKAIIAELLGQGVWMISVAGMDDFHVGLEGEKRAPLQAKLARWFEAAGMRRSGLQAATRNWHDEDGPLFSFFGATPDAWIGKVWPRGRAWSNALSTATLADNFCNRWSGGLGFLDYGKAGSEVAVDAEGNVYPCCLKTKLPIGNLTEEPLAEILADLAGQPVYQAISRGQPLMMGLQHGWDQARFLAESHSKQPDGSDYANLCIGCDKFHEQVLGPVVRALRDRRRAQRAG